MKLLSIAIPCYNSEGYMRNCVNSLLVGGEDVEILIVNDGSKDGTAAIADELAAQYPTIVRAIHQENGGHGSAVMAGLKNANGIYYKVVDSDDWVNKEAFLTVLQTLRNFVAKNKNVDVLISNYVYDKVGVTHKKVMSYKGSLPENKVFNWNEARKLRIGQYILMHSVIYRTQLLIDCKLKLPRHTFYVDNLYAYLPMRYVEKMYYLNVDLYHYYIGREDQSVNEKIMISRIDQQLRVNRLMLEGIDFSEIKNKRQRQYLLNYLEIVTAVSTVLLLKSGTPEDAVKKRELWKYIRDEHPDVYPRLRKSIIGTMLNLKGKSGRRIALTIYAFSQRIFGFN